MAFVASVLVVYVEKNVIPVITIYLFSIFDQAAILLHKLLDMFDVLAATRPGVVREEEAAFGVDAAFPHYWLQGYYIKLKKTTLQIQNQFKNSSVLMRPLIIKMSYT